MIENIGNRKFKFESRLLKVIFECYWWCFFFYGVIKLDY